jgi:ketosteroid isomerase-like protein
MGKITRRIPPSGRRSCSSVRVGPGGRGRCASRRMSHMGHGLPSQVRWDHDRCTPDSRRDIARCEVGSLGPCPDIIAFRSLLLLSNPRRAHAFAFNRIIAGVTMARDFAKEDSNKALLRASLDRWKSGTGGPFDLLAPDVEWTIVGSSPLAKTYRSKEEFINEVIDPFNARISGPLVPTVRGIYADGDTGDYPVRCRSHSQRRQTLSQYLHLVSSNDGYKSRQSNRVLRQ